MFISLSRTVLKHIAKLLMDVITIITKCLGIENCEANTKRSDMRCLLALISCVLIEQNVMCCALKSIVTPQLTGKFNVRIAEGLDRWKCTKCVRNASVLHSHRELTGVNDDLVMLETRSSVSNLPCGDELDQRIFALAIPAMLNLVIIPLTSAVDMYYVGKMNDALAIAGSSAACQVFGSVFWILSFLPLLVSPMVASAVAKGDEEGTTQKIEEAMVIAAIIGVLGSVLLAIFSSRLLGLVLPADSACRIYAEPYIKLRALTFVPSMLSTVGFSAFRGKMDVVTPLKISLLSNFVNAALDPLLMFDFNMGVVGAAAATCIADLVGFCAYMQRMIARGMIRLQLPKLPNVSTLHGYFQGALGVQIRSVCIELTFIAVTRATQMLDPTGVASAAHAISLQLWAVASIVLFSMNGVSSIMIPSELAKNQDDYR